MLVINRENSKDLSDGRENTEIVPLRSSIDTDAGMAAGVVMASGLIRGTSEDSE